MTDIVERLRSGPAPLDDPDLNDEAAGELERLRLDAARLDWIASNARCDPKMDGQHVWWPTSFNHRLTGPSLRDAVDAAMGAKP